MDRLFALPCPYKGLALKIVVCLIKKCDLMTIILKGCRCTLLSQNSINNSAGDCNFQVSLTVERSAVTILTNVNALYNDNK